MAEEAEEFREISLIAPKLVFKKEPRGGISVSLRERSEFPGALFWVCVSYRRELLDKVPIGGMGSESIYPQPSILAVVLSDRQGMFGRRCPQCASYFRIDACPDYLTCPYCGHVAKNVEFTTENQIGFIQAVCDAFLEAGRKDEPVVLDLGEVAERLPDNRPKWHYAEEQQQSSHACPGCSAKYDVLGEYAACPSCGRPNLREVFSEKIEAFESRFQEADDSVAGRHGRAEEWVRLTECVAEFDGMANEVRERLLRLPMAPQRRKDLMQLSFQNILNANARVLEWYGFEILEGLSDADKDFLDRMFNRRHLFTHKAGRVDQEYLDKTGDTSLRLNQVVRFRSREIRRLIPLVRKCGENLLQGLESLR